MIGPRAAAPALARQADPGLAARARPVRDSAPRGVTAPRALLLVTELEDYSIAFANGVAAHLPVTLAVPDRQYRRLSGWVDPAVDLRLMDWPRHSSTRNPRFLLALAGLVRETRPAVIHLLSNNTLWLNLLAPLRGSVPLITTVHDVTVHPGDRDTAALPVWATTLMARQSDHLVVHGDALRPLAAARFGKPADRVHVLHHPAITRYRDLATRQGLTRTPDDGALRLLMFGRIFAYKGLTTLLRAESLLADGWPALRVTIAGRGDDPMQRRDLMGAPDRYDIRHRFIEDAEVAQLFLDADVVVLPYTEASQSGVLLLAAAFGKPVIVTDVGELRATVEPAGIGLVVPPDDPPALAAAIARLGADPGLRAAMAQRAQLWAETEVAPATVGAAAAAIYRQAIGASAR